MLDAACLSQVLITASENKQRFSSHQTLRKYERWRRGDNTIMMYSMSGFKNLFSNEQTLLSTVRNFGLNVVNSMGPVKHKFMRHAMGLEGDLPEIAKSVGV